MSIRSAFKSKFKNSFDRDGATGKDSEVPLLSRCENVDDETVTDGASGEFKECFEEQDTVAHQTNGQSLPAVQEGAPSPPHPLAEGTPTTRGAPERAFTDLDEKAVYELQLTQLQEQLVAAMIESQNLANEVKALKDKTEVDRLRQQLENERERNRLLASQIRDGGRPKSVTTLFDSDDEDILSSTTRRPLRKRLKLKERSASASDFTDMDHEDFVDVKKEDLVMARRKLSDDDVPASQRSRLYNWFLNFFYDVVEDFAEVKTEAEPQPESEGDPLTAKQLKENMKRFYESARPVMSTAKSVRAIVSWETPSMTILVLFLYVYSVWHGWLLPVMLFLLILRLAINWLKSKGLITNFHYLPRDDEKLKEDSDDSGVSDKFILVLQVARKVQNLFGVAADSLEKFQNLLMWRHPTATRQLVTFLCVLLAASCLLSGKFLFQIMGLYLALKFFVIDFVYNRYPRVQLRHDTTLRVWRELPTNAELCQRTTRAQLDQYILPATPREDSFVLPPEIGPSDALSNDDRTFLQLFNLPTSETPLPVWTGGRRCTLINREKSLTSAFKSGKLFLTRSFLCFERTKAQSPKNLIIPLGDITKIEKAKPYSWMPGGGMALEVHVGGISKPLMFGALLNRDEIFESIMAVGTKAALPWSPGSPPPPPPAEGGQSTPSSPTQNKSPMIDKLKIGIQYIEDSD